MKPRHLLPAVAGLMLLCAAARAEGPDSGLLGWWPFDEGTDSYSANAVNPAAEAELSNVSWVKGPFGTALKFSGTDSYVMLPHIPKLDGADQMTVAVWAYWEGTGQYPNIVTGGTWSPGGFLLFVSNKAVSFRMGRPGARHGEPAEAWSETSAPLLSELPVKQWVHLAAVFKRPEITTYVNGKKVGSAKWDYPVGHEGDIQVGRWGGSVSHNGLIDDVRLYGRALAAEEVLALANPAGREGPEYTDLGPASPDAKELLSLETGHATMIVGDNGSILSLKEKATGRELLAEPHPVLAIGRTEGRPLAARRMRLQDGLLVADFPRGAGSAAIRMEAKEHYFTIEAVAVDVPRAERFTFFQIAPATVEYIGNMAGLASDADSGVCLRSLGLAVDTSFYGPAPRFRASTTVKHGLVGHRVGLAAGPREQLIPMLRAMAENEAVPHSRVGGPWSIGAEQTRGSYLFADLAAKDTDAWIELARRGGFTNIHMHGWWTSLGHYEPREAYFPGGLAEMKATADRIRAAGLKPGIHTLTACISPNDPWVTPVPSPDLIASQSYALARPISATDKAVFVTEVPAAGHDVIWSYSGNGNALRVGNELIRYSGISREPPYAFLDCERGAFKTEASAHAEGTAVDYLQQRYIAFYPEPDSALADELADRIARVYNECGLEMIYFDGSEGMMSRYGIDTMRWKIFQRLHGGVTEASCWGHNSWWFHSRLGAWDHPVWAMKQFHDGHIRGASRYRLSELLEPQLGWWAPRGPSAIARGHFLDEMEYFGLKNLAIDGPMSIQGVHAVGRPWNARIEELLTVLGWYERVRLARYFDDATLESLVTPGKDFRLRQNAEGRWRLTPVHMAKHRVSAMGNGSERWTAENPFAAQPLRVRLEALYGVAPHDDPQAVALADFADLELLDNRHSAPGVTAEVELVTDDVKAGGRSLRLRAKNAGETSRGAWTQIGTTYKHPYFSMAPGDAMGLWVKGDGSGALLNLQIRSPREYHGCIADHYIDLDFTGWRYVELLLRERDSERLTDYAWPYGGDGSHAIYRNAVDLAHISEVNVLVNEIPAGGQIDILLSPIHSLPSKRVELTNPALAIGGTKVVLPVTMQSGQYIELEGMDDCVLYDERGELITRFRPQVESLPALAEGPNAMQFDCTVPEGLSARAEVTVISLGQPFGTCRPESEIDWARLDREYDIPRVVAGIDGVENAWSVVRRSDGPNRGQAPMLEIEMVVEQLGKVEPAAEGGQQAAYLDTPVLTIGDAAVRFPVRLAEGQRLICRDQAHWQVLGADGVEVASGEVAGAFPSLEPGANRISVGFQQTGAASLRVTVKTVKVYTRRG
ncbi:MAG: LamG-like jellyroll fold domain-containing protein [Patescibacteria group bacterium]|nr:LamG-like jellyroll fold domain-containing protein [Patescibacteria group bacterium]